MKEAKGKLVIVGGAEDKEGECTILKEFVRLARGTKARIVVMTVATDLPGEVGEEYTAVFKRLGVAAVQVVDISNRQDALDEKRLKNIEDATGVYFTGGDQLHATSLLGGTEMLKRLRTQYAQGLVIGGTSAGAAMMSNSMILSGAADTAPRFGETEIGPGLDFVPNTMIDTHFSQRGRHGRLLTAVAHYPQDIGLGIDENTGIVVEDSHFRVVGENAVTVIDAGSISYTSLPDIKRDETLTLHDVRVHVLAPGRQFDLSNRAPINEQIIKAELPIKKRARAHKAGK